MTRPRRARKNRGGEAGYILVEALATLTLSALVIGGLMSLSATFLRAGDRAAARVERLETEPRTIAAIAREIRLAARLRYAGSDRFVFLGLADRLVFATEPNQTNGLRAPVAVAYQASAPGTVLRAEAPLEIGAVALGDVAFASPRAIPVGSALIRFGYVERGKEGGEVVTSSWDRPDALPDAVRIDRVAPTDGRLIASLRVPLLTTAEPGCAAPPGKAFCSRAPKTAPLAGSDPAPAPAPP